MIRHKRNWHNYLVSFFVIALLFYGIGRLYYHFTDGFAVANIISSYPNDPRWEVRSLDPVESEELDKVLSQPFHYLGKGCQSYVFGSEDGNYVIKFFKHQRFRPQQWLKYFSFIPGVDRYRLRKSHKKNCKREGVFCSWCLAFNELQQETGLVYIHLNKGVKLGKRLAIYDKMGWHHEIDLDGIEFLVQRQAKMLCSEIDHLVSANKLNEAEQLLKALVGQTLAEYRRGLADNDHALMQNTGVYGGKPIHIDVGQFVSNEIVRSPEFYMQELYTKTFKLRLWLREKHPLLARSFDDYLRELYGAEFDTMKPLWRNKIEIFQ